MPQTMPCPRCGRPTSPVTGLCDHCADAGDGVPAQPSAPGRRPPAQESATPGSQPPAQPRPAPPAERSNAAVLWDEFSGFLEIFALFAPIGAAVVLIALGVFNLLILLPAFLISIGIGAYNWRE